MFFFCATPVVLLLFTNLASPPVSTHEKVHSTVYDTYTD